MSYYAGEYFRNPGPVYAGPSLGAPVPGWGVLPNMAGPPRLGVGQAPAFGVTRLEVYKETAEAKLAAAQKFAKEQRERLDELEGEVAGKQPPANGAPPENGELPANGEPAAAGMPFWVLPAVAAVALGTLGYLGVKRGWF